jgi:hypothetical protein
MVLVTDREHAAAALSWLAPVVAPTGPTAKNRFLAPATAPRAERARRPRGGVTRLKVRKQSAGLAAGGTRVPSHWGLSVPAVHAKFALR